MTSPTSLIATILACLSAAQSGAPANGHECHCLCPMHRADGMFCQGADQVQTIPVTLIGGVLSPQTVPMCPPCAYWWKTERPLRVADNDLVH